MKTLIRRDALPGDTVGTRLAAGIGRLAGENQKVIFKAVVARLVCAGVSRPGRELGPVDDAALLLADFVGAAIDEDAFARARQFCLGGLVRVGPKRVIGIGE